MGDYHHLKVKDALKDVKSDPNGLKQAEAVKRLEKHGLNEITEEKQISRAQILVRQFNNSLAYILILAGILAIVLGEKVDAGVIFGAVILNAVIGYFQENKANQAITKLKSLVEHKANVLRDGQEMLIDSRQVTVGDVILVKAGNRIPADARLIEANDLSVNEAGLTGESVPANKRTDPLPEGAPIADRKNMVYAGTMVVRGIGKAVITAVGARTEIGRIAEMVAGTIEEKTPLQLRLAGLGRLLGIVFPITCALVVILGLIQGHDLLEMVETGVALGVASIPEGLTVAVTFILALGMQEILKRRALTRKLVAAETLGSTTVICTDKTGTLTEGRMHVAHIIIGEKEFEVEKPGTRQDPTEARAASLALQTAMMCNDAVIENPQDELAEWRLIGSPTETALLSAAVQSGLRREELLKIEPKVDELPFTSEKKFMISLHEHGSDKYVLYEKGAPERLIAKSARFYHHNNIKNLDDKYRRHLQKTYENLTSRGLRVIGLAYREFSHKAGFEKGKVKWDEIDLDLTYIGFIAIKDPLRPEAKETISLCRQAGIRPVIITGDHKLTARAIAEEVGLNPKPEMVITGEELDKISDDDLRKACRKIEIYARVSPHHKLRIVKALKSRGEVVAMTGDGINDSPALKAADIGISLGTGTDIAKETSDIILLDNNFKTIVAAVRQGRVIFKNIRKAITYLFSSCFSEIILIVGTIVAGVFKEGAVPLAILPVQILWINIVNDGLPDFSLAFERDHGHVMLEKPLSRKEPLLNKEMRSIILIAGFIRDLTLLGIFLYLWSLSQGSALSLEYIRTLMFAALGVKSLMNIFSIRSFAIPVWRMNPLRNKYMIAAVSASFLFLLAGVYLPPLQSLLGTTPLGAGGWMLVFGFGLYSNLLIEIVKMLTREFKPDKAKA